MKPELFRIGSLSIKGYGTMISIGIISALLLLCHRSKKKGYNDENIFDMALIAIVSGILGGKVLFIITDIKNIIKDPSQLKNVGYGFVVYGAILFGGLAVYIYAKKKNWNVLAVLDLIIPSVAIGQGFGRIGCLFAGCCYGKETSSPLGIIFKNSVYAPAGEKLQPTQIYSSIFDFLLAFFLLWFANKYKDDDKAGRVFGLYLILYGVGRFFIEYLRGDVERGFIGIFSTSQFISIFVVVFGIIIFNLDKLKKRTAA